MTDDVNESPRDTSPSRLGNETRPASRPPWQSFGNPGLRIGLVVGLALIAGLVTWLATRNHGSSGARAPAAAATAQDVAALAASVKHPVYWAGPKSGYTYELTQTSDGRIFVRYLPAGVPVGTKQAKYLTVGTYPVKDAIAAVRNIARQEKTTTLTLTGGGIAVQDVKHPTSVYFAYPGSDYQVEVFDPSPTTARQLVLSGRISAVRSSTGPTQGTAAAPRAATVQQLRALRSSVGHAVYWLGPQPGTSFELTQTTDGRIYIRYLPSGSNVGDPHPHTTVGTYPYPSAYAAVKAIARRTGASTFSTSAGALAVVDRNHPTSVYAAFPGSNFEIEVYDPSAARARRVAMRLAAVR